MNTQFDQKQRKANEFSGFIIVRLKDNIEPVDNAQTLQDLARIRNLQGVLSVLEMLGAPKTKRAVWSLPVSAIRELERKAANTPWKPLHSLASYWRIDAQANWTLAIQAWKRLNDLPNEVDLAYKELAASSPVGPDPAGDTLFARQGYLFPGPVGIGAQSLWSLGANGSGVAFVDLEMGWYLEHEDLRPSMSVSFGENFTADADHGTSVLGIVLGKDSPPVAGGSGPLTGGIVGIAPGVSSVRLVSRYHAAEDSASEVANAIGHVTPLLNPGDVLLLEVQKGSLPKPTEIEDLDFDAIRLAVSRDIIVIEAAGNGDLHLDTINNAKGNRTLNNSPAFDSGAIMVGAGRKIVENVSVPGRLEGRHSRRPNSNFGSRVNCYAWGEGIMTTTATYGDPETEDPFASRYAGLFGGTSGASAIIAGAAILLQSRHEAKKGARLTNAADPRQNMRAVLSAPDTGTKQKLVPISATVPTDPIGVMPEMSKIIGKLGLA